MDWQTTRYADDVVVLSLAGRIGQVEHDAFVQAIQDAAGQLLSGGILVLDCAAVAYISSLGLRVLMQAFKTYRGTHSIVVCNPSDMVREIFTISRTDALFPLYDDLETAARHGRAGA